MANKQTTVNAEGKAIQAARAHNGEAPQRDLIPAIEPDYVRLPNFGMAILIVIVGLGVGAFALIAVFYYG